MRLRGSILFGVVICASVSAVSAQLVVAGNHPESSSAAKAPGDTVLQAQTFIPSETGLLTFVNLPFFTSSPATDITLRLNTADLNSGLPGSTTLATVSLPPEQVVYSTFTNPLYTTFDFSSANVTLSAGTPYSLILSTPTSNLAYFVLTTPDTYAGGQAFESADSGANYAPLGSRNSDWAFDVQETPEPAMLWPAFAVALLCRLRRKLAS